MGSSAVEGEKVDEGKKVDEQKLPNRKENGQEGSPGQDNKESMAGCCQGADGVSCCRDATLAKCSSEERGKKALVKLSRWMGTWEQGDVFAAIAVVGAVATVAVAYSVYRRSG